MRKAEIGRLYRMRWHVQLDLRNIQSPPFGRAHWRLGRLAQFSKPGLAQIHIRL